MQLASRRAPPLDRLHGPHLAWLGASVLLHAAIFGWVGFDVHRSQREPLRQIRYLLEVIHDPSTVAVSASAVSASAVAAGPGPANSATRAPARIANARRTEAPAKARQREGAPDQHGGTPSPSLAEPQPLAAPALVPSVAASPDADVSAPAASQEPAPGDRAPTPGSESLREPGRAAGSRDTEGASRSVAPAPDPAAAKAGYLRALARRIRSHRQYPYLARRRGLEGTVCVRIQIRSNGQVDALQVSCGHALAPLVEAARNAVLAAAPFAPLPPALGSALAVEIPIVFRLEDG